MTRGFLWLIPFLLAADWPHWRGPTQDGRAGPEADPPIRWDTKTNIRWKVALPGKGSSTPLVLGKRLFVTTAVDTGEKGVVPQVPRPADADSESVRYKRLTKPTGTVHHFLVMCLDGQTGKLLWQHLAAKRVPHEGIHPTHSYAAGSPATDGKTLVVSFGSAGTHAYTLEGKHLWSRDLGLLETRLGWGEAVTPAMHDGTVYVAHDHEGPSFLVALDAATGKTRWRKQRDEPSAWTTPLIVPLPKRPLVVLPGHRRTRAYDAATGEVVWESLGLTLNTIPTAIYRDGLVYVMSGYREVKGGALEAATGKVRWHFRSGTPYVPSPLLVGERLYFTAANEPRLSSVKTSDGSIVIDRVLLPRLRQLYASPVEARGRIYLPDRDGTTLVFAVGDKLGEPLAVNRLEECIDASPVIVGPRIYLRSERHLWCIEERK
ncbi:MAG: PQQ-binding-like beta-propeller repeat protein [Gemmataceae bacterium]